MVRDRRVLEYHGNRIAYRVDGVDGPPLILIQGVGAQGTSPNPQIEILSRHYTCLTFDSTGIGDSISGGGDLSVESMAADALALLDEMEWESAHVVGHSLGGLVALQAALQARERVRSLTLLCSFARGADATKLGAKLLWILLRIRMGSKAMRRRAFMELVLSEAEQVGDEKRIAARLSRVLGHDVAEIPAITSKQVAAMKKHDLTSRLGELSGIPTLVVNGEEDPIAPPSAGRAIAARIQGARYVEFPGTSHALPIFRADECAAEMLAHMNQAEASWRQRVR